MSNFKTKMNNLICNIKLNILSFLKNFTSSYKESFLGLLIFLFIVLLVFILFPQYYYTFYNGNTDDVLQYYPYVAGFFEKIKTGTLSIYDTSLFGGTSFFSGTYYIPMDIFLVIAFFLSFIIGVYRAYYFTILLKIFSGSLILFYVFKRHNVRPLVCFIASCVYSLTGLTQTYFVFPVYLGINFYVPIAMLLVDLFIEQNRALSNYFIPIFVLVLVLFDYYCAYMILAFMSIYFIYRSHAASKKYFFINKSFLYNFIYFFSLILLGVFISLAILLPSAFYVINETSRSTSKVDYLYYFRTFDNTKGKYVISIRHYFTQFINFFIPNNPNKLMLIEAGDYVREHASLYMTSGMFIYLLKFISLGDTKSNRLRPYVIMLNIMYLIPLFSMIFTFQTQAYVRWFFIPYMFNLLACVHAMDISNLKLIEEKKNKVLSFIYNVFVPIAILIGISIISYTLVKNPEYFIHYKKNSTSDFYYYAILVPSLVFLIIYAVIYFIPLVSSEFRKFKHYYIRLIPVLILSELIFSIIIIISNVGSTSIESEYKSTSKQVNYLRKVSNYKFSDGYRINLYTDKKCIANNNSAYLNVNCTNFFQSFYNTALNSYMDHINEVSSTSWSRRNMYGYSLLNAPMYNNKYVITNSQSITSDTLLSENVITHPVTLSSKYYKKYDNKYYASYYELTEIPQFIVYDEVYYNTATYVSGSSTFLNDLTLLNYGYASIDESIYDSTIKDVTSLIKNYDLALSKASTNSEKNEIKSLKALYDAGLITMTKEEAYKKLDELNKNGIYKYDSLFLSSTKKNTLSQYYIYDLTNVDKSIFNHDVIYAYPYSSSVATLSPRNERYWMYFSASEYDNNRLVLEPFHYNVSYISDLGYTSTNAPDTFYMRYNYDSDSSGVRLYGFDYSIYDRFIENQNKYTNRSFSIDSNEINIKFKNDGTCKVVKTSYAYSPDWICENTDYQTVSINGGFLGIIVPEGASDVNITLRYIPQGFTTGLNISQIGVIIYISIVSLSLMCETKRKVGDTLCKIYL